MARSNSTVVVIVGDDAGRVVAGFEGLANVRVVARTPGGDDARRVREAVAQSHAAYVGHDVDPLAEVGAAWAGFFDGTAPAGTLEVAVEAALSSLRTEAAAPPDYYVVLDPGGLPQTRRHWWFGALAGASPNRVVPAAADLATVRDTIAGPAPPSPHPTPPRRPTLTRVDLGVLRQLLGELSDRWPNNSKINSGEGGMARAY